MSTTALKLLLASALVVGFSSCKTFKDLSKQKDGDDVYFSMKDAKKERAAEKKRLEEEQKRQEEADRQRQIKANNDKALATSAGSDYYNEPFDYDDYYDYEYAARLRRFHDPVPGSGYYGNYYTNSYYYNQNPYLYGTSVYNSYGWWGQSAYAYNHCPSSYFYYNSGWAWGTGMYYGNPGFGYYDPWAMNGWGYNPYYSYYPGWNSFGYNPYGYGYSPYGYNPYGFGYGNGWGNNYGNGNNNYYYNSYDENSDYYGPRHVPSAHDGRVAGSGGPAFGERYAEAIAAENNIENPSRGDINTVTQQSFNTSQSYPNVVRDANNQGSTAPVMTAPQTQGRDAAPNVSNGQNQGRDNVPPAPTFNSSTAPSGSGRDTPPAPDFSQPSNTTVQPAPTYQSRDNNSSPRNSSPAPANNGGSESRGNNSGGANNGGSVRRPR
jgi:hypothetical protein